MRLIRAAIPGALCLCTALALGACGSSSTSDSTSASTGAASTAAAADATSTAAAAASPSDGITQASIDEGVKFTGGKAGKADSSLSPVIVGVVNQQGGTPAFPEYLDTAEATTKFVNDNLGGVQGHPLKLQTCIVQAEEDGQKCAAEFREKKVDIAIWTLGIVGNQSFYSTVDGQFPVIVSAAATGPDSTTPHVYEFDGGANATLNAMATTATKDGAKNVAVIATGNPSGKFTTGQVLVPMLKSAGATPKVAYYPDTATIPQMVSAVQASGAATADSIIFNPASAAQCNSVYDALKQLGVKKPVVSSAICNSTEVIDHTGGGPAGWTLASYGSSALVGDDAQAQAYKNVLESFGAAKAVNGYTIKVFGDVLAAAKFANQIGPDKLTATAYEDAIKAWKGPAYAVPGEIECGYDPKNVSVCGNAARTSAYNDGTWSNAGDIPLK